jgi:3-isopropylmalate/(R)-2-methylmalate dehydratase small subunit
LEDFGFKVIIASSYADIFYNNCFKNGMLPIVLSADIVDALFKQVAATPNYKLQVDLAAQTVSTPSGETFSFSVDAFRKHCLLNGLDDIGLTMQHQDKIKAFEARHQQAQPWLYN